MDRPRMFICLIVATGCLATGNSLRSSSVLVVETPHALLQQDSPSKALEVMKADPKWVRRLDEYSCTPLHMAAQHGHGEVVKWLLDNGADINAVAYNGFTALHLTSDPEVVALILKRKPDLSKRDVQNRTPLQEAVDKYVDAEEVRPDIYDDQERRKRRKIVDLYLDSGAEYDLLTAIYLNDLERVGSILKRSPRLADDFQSGSPLRLAASLGRCEICEYLIEKYDVDVDDFGRGTGYPIIKAALAHPKVVRLLIESGADLKERITWQGFRSGIWIVGDDATALHHAASDGVPETIKLLIDNDVDIFATAHELFEKDKKQMALEVAAIFGRAENAQAILDHPKFDAAEKRTKQDLLDKCLWLAAIPRSRGGGNVKLVEALLKKGADPNVTRGNVSAVQRATAVIHPTSAEENQACTEVVRLLVKHGAHIDFFSAVATGDVNLVNQKLKDNPKLANSRRPDGYPVLHFAVGMNDKVMVEKLLGAMGEVDIRNASESTGSVGETALDCAAFWGHDEIGKTLIASGANVNALTQDNSTPLHSAARMCNLEFAKLLLENGAQVDARDSDGKTPADWCRELNAENADKMQALLRENQSK
jgi:ankyrin repeat protein